MKIAFQGIPGAYSEAAIHQLFENSEDEINPVGYVSFEDVFRACASGETDRALVPIQNSLGGSLPGNYDLIVRYDLSIKAELHFRVRHCLLATGNATKETIKQVYSHPQALAQCESFIKSIGASAVPFFDTAGSAQFVSQENKASIAAIASKHAAKEYGLEILEESVEDESDNYTRFLLLSRDPLLPPLSTLLFKTCLVFGLSNNLPGALFKALSIFALRDIDLLKIESRPAKGLATYFGSHAAAQIKRETYQYIFYIDINGHHMEEKIQNAMRHLSELAPIIKMLGSFPQHISSERTTIVRSPREIPLTIGIVGFGRFGQFLAKTFIKRGHVVIATSRTDYNVRASRMGVQYFQSMEQFVSVQLDVVLISTSILSFEKVIKAIPFEEKLSSSLIVDVLSVKSMAKDLFLRILPSSCDLLCTHPMFGPESGAHSWKGLPFVYEDVRIRNRARMEQFLQIWIGEGCAMIPMPCDVHDQYAAGSQFLTHLTGRILDHLALSSTPINTTGFEKLLSVVQQTRTDSLDLFIALFKHNPNSAKQLDEFESAFKQVKAQLVTESSKLSSLVKSIEVSGTACVFDKVSQLRSEGKSIVSLAVGEPDLPTPKYIADAAIKAIQDGHTVYTPTAGILELREAICAKLLSENNVVYTTDQVVVTSGAKQAILETLMVTCGDGDSVLVPAPYWTSYKEMVSISGATPVLIPCPVETDFKLSPNVLKEMLRTQPNTKALILCYPCNPTGISYTQSELSAFAQELSAFPEVLVISDEIYEYLLYEGEHVSFASLPGMKDRTVTINGFSKGFCMTGFRLGYLAAPSYIAKAAVKLQGHITSGACSISQYAGLAALHMDRSEIDTMVGIFKVRRDFVFSRLRSNPLLRCAKPQGAFYIFPDISKILESKKNTLNTDMEFCLKLLEDRHLALVPGSAFGMPGHIRISYSSSQEILEHSMSTLLSFIDSLV